MCFFFGLPATAAVIKKRYNKPFKTPERFSPSDKFNGFAHPQTPIITTDDSQYITMGTWGLLPHWAKDASFQKNTLNARIETLEQLPSFKDTVTNRCLIPATCFYEWRHEGTQKKPYRISSTEDEIFSFAGIYSDWTNPVTGDTQRTYSIITTEANTCMQFIHNTKKRMPVILHTQDETSWLMGAPIPHFAFPYSCNLLGLPI